MNVLLLSNTAPIFSIVCLEPLARANVPKEDANLEVAVSGDF